MAKEVSVSEKVVEMADHVEKIYGSLSEIVDAGATVVEYRTIEGFKPNEKVRIGSVTADDMVQWTEAGEGEAKRVAGLRLICMSLVDKDGKRYAAQNEAESVKILGKVRHSVTERILKAILELNEMNVKGQGDKAQLAGEAAAKKD